MAMDGTKPAAARNSTLDFIKAACIVTVVLEHVHLPGWAPTGFEGLDRVLRLPWGFFHVPGFLFVSGYLYGQRRDRIGPAWLRARLERLLVPYLVASLFVFAVDTFRIGGWSFGDALTALALGSALGIYYYVFVATICVFVAWPLARVPDRWLLVTVVAVVVVSWLSRYSPPSRSVFWLLRDPLNMFVAYFVIGWWVARRGSVLARLADRNLPLAYALALLGIAIWAAQWTMAFGFVANAVSRLLYSMSAIALIALFVRGRRSAPRWVVTLSLATYPIFLYHQLFILIVRPDVGRFGPVLAAVCEIAAGALGAGCVIVFGLWLGGDRGRRLLGMG